MALTLEVRKALPGFTLDVSWEASDEVVTLFGPSGAGKTLTLQCLAGLMRPDSGRIVVNGSHVEHWLNGVRVIEYELGSPALMAAKAKSKFKDEPGWGLKITGHILLQDHGDEVAFRNIRIRELPPT